MKRMIVSALMAVMLLLTGCNGSEYIAKVDRLKITEAEFKFYLENMKDQMAGTELQTDEDWQTTEIEGKFAIDIAKEQALAGAIDNVAYIIIGEKLGIKLTDADRETIKQTKDSLVSGYGGESAYKDFLKQFNLTDDFIDMLCESMVYSEKLIETVREKNPVTDEMIQKSFEENAENLSETYRKAKHVLRLTKDMTTGAALSEEQVAEAKKTAEDVLAQAQNGADFDALVQEFSEDPGSISQPGGYVFTDGEMVAEFQNCVDSLAPGEIGFVESSFGYHVIMRLPLTAEDVRDQLESRILSEAMDAQMEAWKVELGIQIEKNETLLNNIQ